MPKSPIINVNAPFDRETISLALRLAERERPRWAAKLAQLRASGVPLNVGGLSLTDFGAVGDGRVVKDGKMTAGSAKLDCTTTQPFRGDDVGKKVVVGMGGNPPFRSTIQSYVSPSRVVLASNAPTGTETIVVDPGVMWGTDNAAAVKAWLAAITANPRLGVVPAGRYMIYSGDVADQVFDYTPVTIQGEGAASQFLIGCSNNRTALRLSNTEHLTLRGVSFVGTPRALDDAQTVLSLNSVDLAEVVECNFIGLMAFTTYPGAIIAASACNLHMRNCSFRGCGGGGSAAGVGIRNKTWLGFTAEACLFYDHGRIDGLFHSKTSLANASAWIYVGQVEGDGNYSAGSQGRIRIANCKFDEGAYYAVDIQPSDGAVHDRVHAVEISGCEVNLSPGGAAFHLRNVLKVKIEQTWTGFSKGTADSIRASNCVDIELDQVYAHGVTGNIRTLNAPPDSSLTLRNCTYTTLQSAQTYTKEVIHGRGGVVLKTVDGIPSDADFAVPPPDGTLVLQTSVNMLWTRVGGVWVAPESPTDPVPIDPATLTWTGAWEVDQLAGTPVDGEAIGTLNGLLGTGRDLTQSTAANRPLYRTGTNGINGRPALLFDGVNDRMGSAVALSNFITASVFELFVVAKVIAIRTDSTAGYNNSVIISDSVSDGIGLGLRTTGPMAIAYNYDGNPDQVPVTTTTGMPLQLQVPVVIHARHGGGNLVLSRDGGTEQSILSGDTRGLSGIVRLGANYAANVFYSGLISAVYLRNTALTRKQRDGVIAFLKAKYGAP